MNCGQAISITIFLVSILGLAHSSEFDGWCADHFKYVGKPWAICGRSKDYKVDPLKDTSVWDVQLQETCQPVLTDPTAIPHCCSKWVYDQVTIFRTFHTPQIPAALMRQECHRLA
ncbi:hypothetical protein KEM48_005165 [Puccinia striiformis f. sp. tritici PST-130]|nr:hypothetical protein KEM48_005165 [Puccinia striiformis f. sp. tritici PST-130]